MAKYGLLIEYDLCVGCRVCELACDAEYQRGGVDLGIRIESFEPGSSKDRKYHYPVVTDHCKYCGKRLARGLMPACVHNCWAGVMKFGRIDELIEEMPVRHGKVLWVPH